MRKGIGYISGFLRQPEPNVLLFGFLLNLPWELLQVPFFAGMSSIAHWDGVIQCVTAAAGDAVILLVAFWATACLWRERMWITQPSLNATIAFVATGIAVTIALEWWATGDSGRWTYAKTMPTIPGLGTGVLPLLQWLLIPPLVVWLVRRQIR
ncbi:MAG: hypothetical protein CVU20_03765 [Betaproteobacteria bacterium HGW-Betaproteobacteria-14]|nr:MAG: hypothetical protein CVU20_03765 [Betaproteobacteria bacterium HGW-Betaproteobacteria-14]